MDSYPKIKRFSVSTTLNYYIMLNIMYNNAMGEYLLVLIMIKVSNIIINISSQ